MLFLSYKYRDCLKVCRNADALTSFIDGVAPEVLPACLVLRKIYLPGLYARLSDRADKIVRTEHVLCGLLEGFLIAREVEHERTHESVAFG